MDTYYNCVDTSTLRPSHSCIYAFCAATSSFFGLLPKKEKYQFIEHLTSTLAYEVSAIFKNKKLSKFAKEAELQHTLLTFNENKELTPQQENAVLHFLANYYDINIFIASKLCTHFVLSLIHI